MTLIALVLRTPIFRILLLTLACLGAFNASVYPYQSLIAIKHIGLTASDFALILAVASIVNVAAAVLLGILADQKANRRMTALFCASAGAMGTAMMIAVPGPVAMVLTAAILLPLAQPLYGQIFALAQLASQKNEAQAAGIQSIIRSSMSAAFVVMLLFWAWAFGYGLPETWVFVTGFVAALAAVGMILIVWPRDGATDWEDRRSGLNLRAAIAQIGRPHIALRFFCLGAINAVGGLYMATISLVFDASALRGAADVALYVGMVAGWEIPFMLLLPRIMARFRRADLIAIGAAIYAVHLLALPFLADTALIWAMPFVAGLGGTALITLPIGYYQSLMQGTPGAASSLMAVQKLVSDVLVALCFVIGLASFGLWMVAVLGTVLSLSAAALLVLADRRQWLMPREVT